MNRRVTNLVRFVLDECIPPIIRDNFFFMYPFFYLAYRGKRVRQIMEFKRKVWTYSKSEYADFYGSISSISRDRKTDLNSLCLDRIFKTLRDMQFGSLIDVGCGNGYLLSKLIEAFPEKKYFAIDVKTPSRLTGFEFTQGDISRLPYADKSFDVVICSHVLEHCVDINVVISELKRIVKKLLIIVVPCQRPYFYTLDEHVNFFFYKEQLLHEVNMENHICERLDGDWYYQCKPSELNL